MTTDDRPLTAEELQASEATLLGEKAVAMLLILRDDAREHATRACEVANLAWPDLWAPTLAVQLQADALLSKIEAMVAELHPQLADLLTREAVTAKERAGGRSACH